MNVYMFPCNPTPSFESYKIAVKGIWLCVHGMGNPGCQAAGNGHNHAA